MTNIDNQIVTSHSLQIIRNPSELSRDYLPSKRFLWYACVAMSITEKLDELEVVMRETGLTESISCMDEGEYILGLLRDIYDEVAALEPTRTPLGSHPLPPLQ